MDRAKDIDKNRLKKVFFWFCGKVFFWWKGIETQD